MLAAVLVSVLAAVVGRYQSGVSFLRFFTWMIAGEGPTGCTCGGSQSEVKKSRSQRSEVGSDLEATGCTERWLPS